MAGSCDIYPAPEYVVLGKTTYDQDRIDEYVAVGSEVCNKPRPKPRPASFDAPVSPPAAKQAPAKQRRPGIVDRIKARVKGAVSSVRPPMPTARPAGLAPAVIAPVQADPPEEPLQPQAPPPAVNRIPCDPLTELLKDCPT